MPRSERLPISRGGPASVAARRKRGGGLAARRRRAARARWGYSLAAVAADTLAKADTWRSALKEFFREAALRPRPSLVSRPPALLPEPHRNAYLAAVAEEVGRIYGWKARPWTTKPERFCPYPYFGNAPEGMKPYLIQVAPAVFRNRNLFLPPDEVTGAMEKARLEAAW